MGLCSGNRHSDVEKHSEVCMGRQRLRLRLCLYVRDGLGIALWYLDVIIGSDALRFDSH